MGKGIGLKDGTWEKVAHAATMDSRLTPNAYRLLNVLFQFAVGSDDVCKYSTDTILKLCGFGSHTTLKKAQENLKETGWIEVSKGGIFGGAKNTNQYKVNMANEVPLEYRLDRELIEVREEKKAQVADTTPKETPATTPKLKGVKKSTPKKVEKSTPPQESENVTVLLRKVFTLESYGFMPNYDGDYKEVWQKLYKDYKALLASGERVLTEETLQQEKRFIKKQYQTAVGSI